MFEQKDTGFVIFGLGRSGSNLLRTLLDSHPDIKCDFEIFRKDVYRRQNTPTQYVIHRIRPLKYIYRKKYYSRSKIYGFKLHESHVSHPKFILKRLTRKGWKIIYLSRRCRLKQVFSWMIGSQTGIWVRREGNPVQPQSWNFDPKEIASQLKRWKKRADKTARIVTGVDHLKIRYEEDLLRPEARHLCLPVILDYIGASKQILTSKNRIIDPRSDRERIENLTEIINYLNKNGYSDSVNEYFEISEKYY